MKSFKWFPWQECMSALRYYTYPPVYATDRQTVKSETKSPSAFHQGQQLPQFGSYHYREWRFGCGAWTRFEDNRRLWSLRQRRRQPRRVAMSMGQARQCGVFDVTALFGSAEAWNLFDFNLQKWSGKGAAVAILWAEQTQVLWYEVSTTKFMVSVSVLKYNFRFDQQDDYTCSSAATTAARHGQFVYVLFKPK